MTKTLFAHYCEVLGVRDRDPESSYRNCVGRFLISDGAIRAVKSFDVLKQHLPDVDIHRIEVDWEAGVIFCEATCPRFAARMPEDDPGFYEFVFSRMGDKITSKVIERPDLKWTWPEHVVDTLPPPQLEP